jgi:hypothetical protein
MTGTGIDLIIIQILTIVSLAVCLILAFYAVTHPNWDSGRSAGGHAEAPVAVRASAGDVPSGGGRAARPDTSHAPADHPSHRCRRNYE